MAFFRIALLLVSLASVGAVCLEETCSQRTMPDTASLLQASVLVSDDSKVQHDSARDTHMKDQAFTADASKLSNEELGAPNALLELEESEDYPTTAPDEDDPPLPNAPQDADDEDDPPPPTTSDSNHLDIFFGGNDLVASGYAADTGMRRPEFIKSMKCTGSSCEDCLGGDDCWHGYENNDAFLQINVAGNTLNEAISYVAEFWAQCTSDSGTRWVIMNEGNQVGLPIRSENANIKVYANGTLLELDVPETSPPQYTIPFSGEAKARVRVVMTPSMPTLNSVATIKAVAWDVDSWTEQCLAGKLCLRTLDGDGSLAGQQLRNGNALQLECLENDALSGSHSQALQDTCLAWIGCLNDHTEEKQRLKFLLTASLPPPSLLQTQASGQTADSQTAGSQPDDVPDEVSGECVHPSSDDPETWECDCAEALDEACAQRSDTAACYREKMCCSARVCFSWKTEVECDMTLCTTLLLDTKQQQQQLLGISSEQQLLGNRSHLTKQHEKDSQHTASLDESLSGKRTCE